MTQDSRAILISLLMFTWWIPERLQAQSWEFIREKDSIRIYTRTEAMSNLKSFRGEMTVSSSMERVKDLISNVKNFDWWDDDITEIRVLKFIPDSLIDYYIVYDVPWPFSDRDLCVQARISTDEKTGRRIIYSTPLSDVMPEKSDMVRIKNYWQRWTIQPEGNGKIHLTLEGFVDPGGNVPSWLYNMVITNTPWKVMNSLREHL